MKKSLLVSGIVLLIIGLLMKFVLLDNLYPASLRGEITTFTNGAFIFTGISYLIIIISIILLVSGFILKSKK